MAQYPGLHEVTRGQIDSPEYAGEYKIPLIESSDYDELLRMSQQMRYDKVKKSEDLFKELNSMKLQPKSMFSSPDLQAEAINLQKQHQIDDASVNAAINGGSFMMRKLEGNYYNYANDSRYADLLRQENAFQQFKKNADQIKDPNFRSQAYASINAYMAGEPDPVTGKKLTAFDMNIGHYTPMDIDKELTEGLKDLQVTTNVEEIRDGYKNIVPKTSIDPQKAKDYITVYTANPAVQRNLAARGLGLVNGETGEFELNENGMTWIKNIVDSKSQETSGKYQTKFNTKVYNEHQKHAGTGMITDDIANESIIATEEIRREGDQNVKHRVHTFDEELYRSQVNLKLKDPVFRQKMIDQGLMQEDGTFTEAFTENIKLYKKKAAKDEIAAYKNAPKEGTGSAKSAKASEGKARIADAFAEEGLTFLKIGGIDFTKKVNYRVSKSKTSGKYYLQVGSGDNFIELKEGVHYKRSGAPAKEEQPIGPEQPPPTKAPAKSPSKSPAKTTPKKKLTAADL